MLPRKYILSIPSLTFSQQVYPINDEQLVIKRSWKFPDQIFYTKELSNSLLFADRNGNFDFDLFAFYEGAANVRCSEIILYIYETCQGVDVLKFTGTFSLNNCIFDFSRCTVEVKPANRDAYSCIDANKAAIYNMLTDPVIISTQASLDFDYEFDSCIETSPHTHQGTNCDPDSTGTWAPFHTEVIDWTQPGTTTCGDTNPMYVTVVYRETIVTSCVGGIPNPPPGAGWVMVSNDCGTLGTAKYVRYPTAGNWPNGTINKDIGYGFYDGANCLPPPAAINQQITVSATPGTPPIKGFQQALSSFAVGSTISYAYEVVNNPNSSYLWSASDSTVIVSGQGTNKIYVTFPITAGHGSTTITCTETHGNAYVSSSNILVNWDGGSGGFFFTPVTGTVPITGLLKQCSGKTDIFSIPEIPTESDTDTTISCVWSLVTVGAGTAPVIVSGQGTNVLTVTAGTANFNVHIAFSAQNFNVGGGSEHGQAISTDTINVITTNVPACHPIEGIFEYYSGEPVIPFSVVTHSGATYSWIAGNGDTGSANTFSFSAPLTADTCLTLKEVLDCGCDWDLIVPQTGGGATPCIYWCKNNIGSAIYSTQYTRNRLFYNTCNNVMNNLTCGLSTLVSDFFEWNPPGDTPGYVAGINYVTGQPNKLHDLTIAQKSDIIFPTSSNAATIGNITFENIETIWREMFNAYWFIDSLGRMRVEHVSFFQKTVGYDSTNPTNNKFNISKKRYSYNVEKMPKFERFKFEESLFTDFVGADIWYDSACVSQIASENLVERGVPFVSTDIYYINLLPNEIDMEGFVILCNKVTAGIYTVDFEVGNLSTNSIENGHLSWANLLPAYHKYARVLDTGYMNNTLTAFLSTKPVKKQENIIILLCCDQELTPELYLVTTELGNAHIDSADYSLQDHTVTLNLLLP